MSLKKETPYDQQLHLAALQGDLDQLRRTLNSGRVHVDCKDKEGTTPLILAAANNHLDCVTELLENGADPNARRLTGTCALFFAAQGGFLDIVKILLEHKATVDLASYDGGTPLFVACQCNHQDVVAELLARGADINTQMIDGATSLFITAQNGHADLLRFLISKGADPNMKRKDMASPLWIAAQMGHTGVVRELIAAGAEVDAMREEYWEVLAKDYSSWRATEETRAKLVSEDRSAKRLDGATPLFKACHKGHLDTIAELLQHKPNTNILNNGETVLHAAALFGHLKAVRLLLESGIQADIKNKDGQTPAELASEAGYDYIASYISNFSFDPEGRKLPGACAEADE